MTFLDMLLLDFLYFFILVYSLKFYQDPRLLIVPYCNYLEPLFVDVSIRCLKVLAVVL